jgi:hypothetical protein
MCERYGGMAGGIGAMAVWKTAIHSKRNRYQSTVLRITLRKRSEIDVVQPRAFRVVTTPAVAQATRVSNGRYSTHASTCEPTI